MASKDFTTRLCWSDALKRVFFIDILAFSCGGRRRVIAAILAINETECIGPANAPTAHWTAALQNGTVDGFDQALLYMVAANWHTSIKYLTLSGHMYQPAVIAYNKAWFDKLPADLQAIVLEEGKNVQDFGRKKVRQMGPTILGVVKAAGVEVAELSAAERAAFEKATLPVRAAFRKKAKPNA